VVDGGGVVELLLPPVLGALPGGSQFPLEHVHVGPGLIVVQPVDEGGGSVVVLLPPVLGVEVDVGGNQLPFEQIQSGPGLIVVQVVEVPEPLDPPDDGGGALDEP
jgi:hypothetical protein